MHCAKNLRGMLGFPLGEMELSNNVWQIFTKRPEGALSKDVAGGLASGFRPTVVKPETLPRPRRPAPLAPSPPRGAPGR